jgi:hypothetical protein
VTVNTEHDGPNPSVGRALAEGLGAGVDEAGLDEIAGRYAMDVLGPAPEGYV